MLNSSFLQQNSATTLTFVCYKVQNKKIAQIWNTRGNIFLPNLMFFLKLRIKFTWRKFVYNLNYRYFFIKKNVHFFQQPKCLFQNDCLIDVRTRRFCPHCRLRRCFEVGMKKEMILGRMFNCCFESKYVLWPWCKDIYFIERW